MEKGLAPHPWHDDSPSHGYKLAADYCQDYDPRYGNRTFALPTEERGSDPLAMAVAHDPLVTRERLKQQRRG